jgi:hypothetical protein
MRASFFQQQNVLCTPSKEKKMAVTNMTGRQADFKKN